MDAPVCVAKGVDAMALKIREVAGKYSVPIVENPPLARALHATVESISRFRRSTMKRPLKCVMRLRRMAPVRR